MSICSACAGESHSKGYAQKGSTCKDCFVDNKVVDYEYDEDPCKCHAVGHDKTKLKELPPMSEDIQEQQKNVLTKQSKQLEITLYQMKVNQKLRDEAETKAEIDYYEQRLKILRERKILEEDEQNKTAL